MAKCDGSAADGATEDVAERFAASDLAFIRVIEDVVEALVLKGAINMADLPEPAQRKLMGRRALRTWLGGLTGIADDDGGKVI